MKSVITALLFLLAVASPAAAETKVRRMALLVGANQAAPGRTPLRFSHDDARRMAETLREVGSFAPGDITVLTDPEPEKVLATLDALAASGGGAESLLLFYYSGHADDRALYPNGKALALDSHRSGGDRRRAVRAAGRAGPLRGAGRGRPPRGAAALPLAARGSPPGGLHPRLAGGGGGGVNILLINHYAGSPALGSRTGLNLCRGANLPAGSHHSAAIAENLATSEGSMEGWEDAESAMRFRGLSGDAAPSM